MDKVAQGQWSENAEVTDFWVTLYYVLHIHMLLYEFFWFGDFVSCTIYSNLSCIQQDLYEDVNYGVLTPLTKIKVKVNPSGKYISKQKY